MPEKNGVNSISGVVVVEVPVVVVLETSVTKYSSSPTLITAFWLLVTVMRGLESTCTLPCVCKSSITPEKSLPLVCLLNAKLLTPPIVLEMTLPITLPVVE